MSDLFLSDDPPPRRSRPRWVDGLGLLAVVGAMVGIGTLGGGDQDRSTSPPTTTSTTPTTASPGRPVTTTTSSTTTTVLPPQVHGPLLPAPTGTVLLLSRPESSRIVDLDTGTETVIPGLDPSGVVGGEAHGFVVTDHRVRGVVRLSPDGEPVEMVTDIPLGSFIPGVDGRWWRFASGSGISLVEHDRRLRPTGRRVDLPPGANIVGIVDDGAVVTQSGTITLVDATSGRARDLASGEAFAAGGHSVARFSCRALRCGVEVIDIRSGRRRTISGLSDVRAPSWGRFSDDGRWLAAAVNTEGGESVGLVVIHSPAARGSLVEHRVDGPMAFSPDSRWLFVTDGSDLDAYELATGQWMRLPVDATAVTGIAVTRR